jgi:hypothetical protein
MDICATFNLSSSAFFHLSICLNESAIDALPVATAKYSGGKHETGNGKRKTAVLATTEHNRLGTIKEISKTSIPKVKTRNRAGSVEEIVVPPLPVHIIKIDAVGKCMTWYDAIYIIPFRLCSLSCHSFIHHSFIER